MYTMFDHFIDEWGFSLLFLFNCHCTTHFLSDVINYGWCDLQANTVSEPQIEKFVYGNCRYLELGFEHESYDLKVNTLSTSTPNHMQTQHSFLTKTFILPLDCNPDN